MARQAIHVLGPGASMDDIAAAAGTSKPVFYRYFGDKAGLQRAVGEVVIGKMQARLQEAAATARTPHEGLRAMVSAYLQMAETSPNVYAFVTRAGADIPAALAGPEGGEPDALSHFFAAITRMMEAAIQARLHASGSTAAELRALRYWPPAAIGMVRAAGELWLGSPDEPDKPTREEMTERLTGWLLTGIAEQLPGTPLALPAIPTKESP
ncbi:TetR/AcrR family transcriptional regulator [Arthrobacter sp. GCM10027362]|uniref:TetR/AcrR family transcriptional regulator n=1 Tax=Arthrobacter sp. GCM10027362 TaxID=3273379 RepID=UPI0036418918